MKPASKHQFINLAIQIAHDSVHHHEGGPFGAIIVKDNKIIGRGANRVTCDNDPTAHAEIKAIRDACKHIQSFSLSGCTLYCSSEPCPMCLSAIYWARIEQVFFASTCQQAAMTGFDDQFIYKELSLPHARKQLFISQISDDSVLKKAAAVFREWSNSDFKQTY